MDPKKPASKPHRHLIRSPWLRIPLKVLMCIFIVVLLIPVLLYLPPVQDFAVRQASRIVSEKTGMKIGIGEFRLRFPLDLTLRKVSVVEATGDTMVRAGEALVDLKLLPLLRLQADIRKLTLRDGFYRMMAPDSSMLLTVRASELEVDDRSSANLADMHILLNQARLYDGDLSLVMDVWKKKTEETDTASTTTPMLIEANNLLLEKFTFSMSMLPTIDTLRVALGTVDIRSARVDLGENLVSWKYIGVDSGDFTYLSPDPEWAKAHPAPPSEPSTGPPMRIMGDSISLDNLKGLYGVKGVKPLPGFDPSYISLTGVNIGMRDFYNESSTVRLPLTRLTATERSGLQVISGRGTVGVDSIGLSIDSLSIMTPYSRIGATATLPFAMMAMEQGAPAMDAVVDARVGLPDIEAFMPDLKEYTSAIPGRNPIDLRLDASGTTSALDIRRLDVAIREVVALKASGKATSLLDLDRLTANLRFDGTLSDPQVAERFMGESEIKVPAFNITGTATADRQTYGADFRLTSTAGDVAGDGKVSINSEAYNADISLSRVNVGQFMPSLGIGHVSGHVVARGAGFNPVSGRAVTDAVVNISEIEYNRRLLRDINADISIDREGLLSLMASSSNPGLDLEVEGTGTIHPDDYTFDIRALLRDVDLQALGLMDSVCGGSGDIYLSGSASPERWLYDVDLKVNGLDWAFADTRYVLPAGVTAHVAADELSTSLQAESLLTTLDFRAASGLERLIDSFSKVGTLVAEQIDKTNFNVDTLGKVLPPFDLDVAASGRGLLDQFLSPSGLGLDTLSVCLKNDSIINGNIAALGFRTSSLHLDTITLGLKGRGELLDYRAHIGNRRGTFDEFARVNLNGYLGHNRLGAFLTQQNIAGETGYRLGLTASLMDSTLSVHFTPLKATIAYLPWTLNSDNYIDFDPRNMKVAANLYAKSVESSILARTEPGKYGNDELHLKIDNLHLEDFLQMSVFAPPITASLNTDLRVNYTGDRLDGHGTIGVTNLTYDRIAVGNFDLDLDAGYGVNGNSNVNAALRINDRKAMSLFASLANDPAGGLAPDSVGLSLTQFPLKIANAFMGGAAELSGALNGDMRMDGTFSAPRLNGQIAFDSVTVRIPMMEARLHLDHNPVKITDNLISLNDFRIRGVNENPIILGGTVDARDFSRILFDLGLNANNFQLINSDSRSPADLYGKIFLSMNATVKGPMNLLDINGNVSLLGSTNATYRLNMAPAELQTKQNEDVVRFVNFNDTTQVAQKDSLETSPLAMRINAGLNIMPGTEITVLLSTNGTDKAVLNPSAQLRYFQNYVGDMTLNGTLTLGEGFARYSIPVMGDKMFSFNPQSTIRWTGDIADPVLDITAYDEMKASVTSGGNSRLANFIVTLRATNSLERLNLAFDLSCPDDLTVQNELQTMSADQRQTQAMNLLLYGQYAGANSKANANLDGNILYGLLEGQLNSWLAQNVRGVDLSFGIDQYNRTVDGSTSTQTSYSYQMSKSLFNNRFKILVGGKYSTDASPDENLANNLVSDVSLEYVLRQTQSMNMSVRLFRHVGYESILEGEVTSMGVGFVMRRTMGNFGRMFRFGRRKRPKAAADTVPADTVKVEMPDSVREIVKEIQNDEKLENEKR